MAGEWSSSRNSFHPIPIWNTPPHFRCMNSFSSSWLISATSESLVRFHPKTHANRSGYSAANTVPGATRVELVACGSASYAALVGAAALQAMTDLPARVTVGSEFRYDPPPLGERTLVIAVTQSGEAADTIAPTRLARERGCTIVAITNTVGSAITREADAASQGFASSGLVPVAKHFPGRGSADRPSGDEVATVRKSLEQLKQIELAPFFAVTGNSSDAADRADGLLVSHIRYQGFQGNIRATTKPVSFDQQALTQILALPENSGGFREFWLPGIRRTFPGKDRSPGRRLRARTVMAMRLPDGCQRGGSVHAPPWRAVP